MPVINTFITVRWSREPAHPWLVLRKGRPGHWWLRNPHGHEREALEGELEPMT